MSLLSAVEPVRAVLERPHSLLHECPELGGTLLRARSEVAGLPLAPVSV